MPERDASYGCLHDESANTLNNTHRRNKKSEKSFDDDKNELQMLLWFVFILRFPFKNSSRGSNRTSSWNQYLLCSHDGFNFVIHFQLYRWIDALWFLIICLHACVYFYIAYSINGMLCIDAQQTLKTWRQKDKHVWLVCKL